MSCGVRNGLRLSYNLRPLRSESRLALLKSEGAFVVFSNTKSCVYFYCFSPSPLKTHVERVSFLMKQLQRCFFFIVIINIHVYQPVVFFFFAAFVSSLIYFFACVHVCLQHFIMTYRDQKYLSVMCCRIRPFKATKLLHFSLRAADSLIFHPLFTLFCFILYLSQIKLDDRLLRTDQGLLIRSLTQSDTGVYHCQAVEHGFIQPLLRLNLQVIPTQRLGDILPGIPGTAGGVGHSPKHRLWYRDFLSLLDHPDLNSVEEFCDRVWKKERKQKRVKTPNAKPDSAVGPSSPLRPKALAPNAQRQQGGPPQSRSWLQAGAPTGEGPARGQNSQRGQSNLGMLSGQAPNNNPKTQNSQKGQSGLAGSQAAGGSRASSQHTAKWRRIQENKKGRNRRTHELQRPPRSV